MHRRPDGVRGVTDETGWSEEALGRTERDAVAPSRVPRQELGALLCARSFLLDLGDGEGAARGARLVMAHQLTSSRLVHHVMALVVLVDESALSVLVEHMSVGSGLSGGGHGVCMCVCLCPDEIEMNEY